MWPSRNASETVTCLACGDQVTRSMAREYDKHGDRWNRTNKTFEYCCKSCYRELCQYPRDELEELLVDLETADDGTEDFLTRYLTEVEKRYGTLEEES